MWTAGEQNWEMTHWSLHVPLWLYFIIYLFNNTPFCSLPTTLHIMMIVLLSQKEYHKYMWKQYLVLLVPELYRRALYHMSPFNT